MEITEVFEFYIHNHNDLETAEFSFRENLKADPDLKDLYREWCDEMGYTERKGFKSYIINKGESDSIWDTIFPNSEEYDGYEFGR